MEIILAVFRNEDEYRKIKGDSVADRLPWSDHCGLLPNAIKDLTKHGYKCNVETCDLHGYQSFLDRNGAKNCPQNTAAYVAAKYHNAIEEDYSVLKDINITIVKD